MQLSIQGFFFIFPSGYSYFLEMEKLEDTLSRDVAKEISDGLGPPEMIL